MMNPKQTLTIKSFSAIFFRAVNLLVFPGSPEQKLFH
jgi:hypothetical protein